MKKSAKTPPPPPAPKGVVIKTRIRVGAAKKGS